MAATTKNDKIIIALLSCGSIEAAARSAKVSKSTIYKRLKEPEFLEAYNYAKADATREAYNELSRNLADAVRVIVSIMNDTTQKASTRLHAAGLLLNGAGKTTERLNLEEERGRTIATKLFYED